MKQAKPSLLPPSLAPLLVGPAAAAEVLGVPLGTFERLVAGQAVKAVRIGGRRLFKVAQLAEFAAGLDGGDRQRDAEAAWADKLGS